MGLPHPVTPLVSVVAVGYVSAILAVKPVMVTDVPEPPAAGLQVPALIVVLLATVRVTSATPAVVA